MMLPDLKKLLHLPLYSNMLDNPSVFEVALADRNGGSARSGCQARWEPVCVIR